MIEDWVVDFEVCVGDDFVFVDILCVLVSVVVCDFFVDEFFYCVVYLYFVF